MNVNPMPYEVAGRVICKQAVDLWLKNLRYRWSRIRHITSPKEVPAHLLPKYSIYIPKNVSDVGRVTQELWNRFEYTYDSWDRLYDSIDTPASCWMRAFENTPLRDDCDGFHSAMYWTVSRMGGVRNCLLLTVATREIKQSHSVLIFSLGPSFYLVNYRYVSHALGGVEGTIEDLKRQHYRNRVEIISWELSEWDGRRWRTGRVK